MSQKTKSWLFANSGDLAMLYMTIIAGLNFVVLRDAVSGFSPLTFNALRLSLGAAVMMPLLLRRLPKMRFNKHDLRVLIVSTIIAIPIIQVLMVGSLTFTTSSNVSLMLATGPAWTVLLMTLNGSATLRRNLLLGLGVMIGGAVLVIMSNSSGLTFSRDDLIGCGMMLTGAIIGAWYIVYTKPMVDRARAFDMALLKHLLITVGVIVIASPELIHVTPADIPADILPNMLFAGVVASISGTMTTTFAQKKIGPARMKTYDNIIPGSTALFGFLLLGEPITPLLVVGGALTLYGVLMVRRNVQPRVVVDDKTQPMGKRRLGRMLG